MKRAIVVSAAAALLVGPLADAGPAHAGAPEGALYVVGVDGGKVHRLTLEKEEASYERPQWLPDGREISFSGPECEDCLSKGFVVHSTGGAVEKLPSPVLPMTRISWSPRANRFVFVGGATSAVYVLNRDGTGLRRLTRDRAAHTQAVWSPNGRKIAYTKQQANGRMDIYVMNADGTHPHALTRTPGAEEHPSWSPDSRRLAYIVQSRGHWQIYVMRADGRQKVRLTRGPFSHEAPAWSPDGRRLAFVTVRRTGTSLGLMTADGRHAVTIRTGLLRSYDPAFSPDGRTLAFVGQT
jgi:Tol biopolymer transport system component